VLTIGTFDGVHVGHLALIQRARALAASAEERGGGARGSGGEVVAMVFDPHPLSILRPECEPPRLTTFQQRRRLLESAGADRVIRVAPSEALFSQDAATFARNLAREHKPAAIVEGAAFRFGRHREGSIDTLRQLGPELGFLCEIVGPVEAVLTDHTIVTASSTIVRWLVSNGRVRDAAVVLGRPYSLGGVVVRGDRRGRTIGVPTANLQTACLVPADGVYAALARLEDGREFPAGVHVGERSTFDDHHRTVEAHLIGAPTRRQRAKEGQAGVIEGLQEYGWGIELELVAWLRDQMKFESVAALVDQMKRDCGRAAEIIAAERGRRAWQEAAS
jgi:riboflavin kinase/FMN adenylyltransferase